MTRSNVISNPLQELDALFDDLHGNDWNGHGSDWNGHNNNRHGNTTNRLAKKVKRIDLMKPSSINSQDLIQPLVKTSITNDHQPLKAMNHLEIENNGFLSLSSSISLSNGNHSAANKTKLNKKPLSNRTFGMNRTIMAGHQPDSIMNTNHFNPNNLIDDHHENMDQGLSSSSDDDDDTKHSKIKTIHELREAGETKRFRDEISFLYDGLKQSSPSIVRSTMLDLCRKLDNDKFFANIKAHDCIQTLYQQLLLSNMNDGILELFLIYFLWVLSRDVKNIEPLLELYHQSLIQTILKPLSKTYTDPLLVPQKSKADKLFLNDFKQLLKTSVYATSIGGEMNELCIFNYALETLVQLCSLRGGFADELSNQLQLCNIFNIICEKILVMDINQASSMNQASLQMYKHYLVVLEFATARFTSNNNSADNTLEESNDKMYANAPKLMNHLFQLFTEQQQCIESNNPSSMTDVLILALRVMMNLSHYKKALQPSDLIVWIYHFLQTLLKMRRQDFNIAGKDEKMVDDQKQQSVFFDTMLLCISILTNLIETYPNCIDDLIQTKIGSSCKWTKKCLKICKCTSKAPSYMLISNILQKCVQDASDAMDHFVLTAHLTILLGTLWKKRPSIMSACIQTTKNMKNVDVMVEKMPVILREFAKLHQQVANEQENDDNDGNTNEVYQSIIDLAEYLENHSKH